MNVEYKKLTRNELDVFIEMRALCVMQGAFCQQFGRNGTKSRNES